MIIREKFEVSSEIYHFPDHSSPLLRGRGEGEGELKNTPFSP
jgi:hypothetical protein